VSGRRPPAGEHHPPRPDPPGRLGLLLAPGAGADRNQAAHVAVDDAVAATGVIVTRMDFPYRQAGRRSPDRPPVLLAAVRAEAAALQARVERLVAGGRSMGGRMCSMAVAEGIPAAGLVLISYPLHPPGRPDRPRTDHLPALRVPSLWVSGTRDAFGSVSELEAALTAVPGPVTLRWIDGGDHGLRGKDRQVAAIVAEWMAATYP
jgi:predicted alpha/beta-hydrolase family hydrolase